MSARKWIALALLCAALWLTPRCLALAGDANKYRIEVDLSNQITTVYRRSDGAVVRQMICSTGTDDTTPLGSFRLQASLDSDRQAWYFIGKYQCFVKYPTRIKGSILFHSLPYAERDMASVDLAALRQLGSEASHGCVRLRWEDAKWIAENCPDGTFTRIFPGTGDQDALRERLLAGSYALEDSVSYEAFLHPPTQVRVVLARGDRGRAVLALQRRLSALGCYAGEPSGEYDAPTVVAVMRFQRALGMDPTGVVTRALEQRIMEGK